MANAAGLARAPPGFQELPRNPQPGRERTSRSGRPRGRRGMGSRPGWRDGALPAHRSTDEFPSRGLATGPGRAVKLRVAGACWRRASSPADAPGPPPRPAPHELPRAERIEVRSAQHGSAAPGPLTGGDERGVLGATNAEPPRWRVLRRGPHARGPPRLRRTATARRSLPGPALLAAYGHPVVTVAHVPSTRRLIHHHDGDRPAPDQLPDPLAVERGRAITASRPTAAVRTHLPADPPRREPPSTGLVLACAVRRSAADSLLDSSRGT